MKKILAVVLALSMMLLALASCGSTATEETTAAPEETTVEETTVEETSAEETTAAEDATAEDATAEDASAADETTTAETKGLNSTDAEEIAAYYNAARKATGTLNGQSTMTLASLNGGSGAVGSIVSSFEGIAKSALEKNSTSTDKVPASDHDDVKASDIKNAKATSDGKYTTITFDVVDQAGNASTKGGDGTVGRAIGVLDGIDNALSQLSGVEVTDGINNIKLNYTNAKVSVKIDESTGKIVSGTWQYRVNISISSITIKIAILSATLKGVTGAVDYKVVA